MCLFLCLRCFFSKYEAYFKLLVVAFEACIFFLLSLFLIFVQFTHIIEISFCYILGDPRHIVRLPPLAHHCDAHHAVNIFAPLLPHFLQIIFYSIADFLQIFFHFSGFSLAVAIFVAPDCFLTVVKLSTVVVSIFIANSCDTNQELTEPQSRTYCHLMFFVATSYLFTAKSSAFRCLAFQINISNW